MTVEAQWQRGRGEAEAWESREGRDGRLGCEDNEVHLEMRELSDI